MIRMTLTGTDTASACGFVRKCRGMAGAIGPLCRDLIHAGIAAHDVLLIERDGVPVFAPTRVQYFAERTCSEGVDAPLAFRKFSPFERNE